MEVPELRVGQNLEGGKQSRGGKTMFIAGGTDGIGLTLLKAECERAVYKQIFVLGRDFKRIKQLQLLLQQKRQRDGNGAEFLPDIVELPCDVTQDDIEHTLAKIKDNSIEL